MIAKGFAEPAKRVIQLKEMMMNAVPYVEADRAKLITESYKETESQPMVIRRAKALEKILLNLPVVIRDNELIVGALTNRARSVQVYPEYSCEWIAKEFKTMGSRMADPFQITDEAIQDLSEAFAYWKGKTVSDLALAYMSEETKDCIASGIFTVGNYLYGGVGHISVDYGKILKMGCDGIMAETIEAMKGMDRSDPDYIRKQQFYQAVIITYNAMKQFALRYAQEAERLAAIEGNPQRKMELNQIAVNCKKVPAQGANNFYQACQAFWFTQVVMQLESNGHSVSPGRFDQYMYPYLKADAGIDKDFAQELLDCIWVKFNDVNKIRDDVSAQAFAGYQAFQNLCVGGQDSEGFDAANELSYMCMDAAAHVRMPGPSFSIRVWQGTTDEFLMRACEVARLGMGVPAMYNDEVIVPALVNRGVSLKDARNYALIGCVEPQCPGKTEGWHDSAFFNIAKVLEITLNGGRIDGRQIGPVTIEPQDMESMYAAYQKQMEYFVYHVAEACNSVDYAHTERGQLPFISALIDDCIGRGKTIQDGGAVYNFTGPQAIGVADAGDSLYAIQKQVFEDKKLTMSQLKEALKANFGYPVDAEAPKAPSSVENMTEAQLYETIKSILTKSGSIDVADIRTALSKPDPQPVDAASLQNRYEGIRLLLDSTPSFGNDIDEVDMAARRCGQIYCQEVEKYKNPRNGIFHAGMYPVSSNVLFGKDVGALPDGRLAKKPLADGVSPRGGKDCSGPTAAANSVAKLDHFAASNGTLYNQKFLPSAVAGDKGLKNFASVVRSYFDHKGMHVQFNVIDRDTLYAAQKEPGKYKNLIVRVAGYSAQFVVLAKEVQDDIINRTEHGL